jgi:hypothetical protein
VPRFVNYNTRPESPHGGQEHELTVIWNEHKHPRSKTDSNILSLLSIYFKIAFALNDMATRISLLYKTLIYGYPDSHLSTQGLRGSSAVYLPNHLLDFVIDFNNADAGNLSVGRYRFVSTATHCELDGLGIEYRCGVRFFAIVQSDPGAHPTSYPMGTVSRAG